MEGQEKYIKVSGIREQTKAEGMNDGLSATNI